MSYRVQPLAFPAQHPRPHLVSLVRPYLSLETTSYRAELDGEATLPYAEQTVAVSVARAVNPGGEECTE